MRSNGSELGDDDDMQQIGVGLSPQVKKAFRGLFEQPETADASGRTVESETVEWASAREPSAQLGQLMYRQQCRAYSRAAGYHAICELLRATHGASQLQCKLLLTFASVLRPLSNDASAPVLCSHYSRDVACAGPHASRRLRLAFTATLDELLKLASTRRLLGSARLPMHQVSFTANTQ